MEKFKILEPDGIAGVGEKVAPGQVFVNKQSPVTVASDMLSTSGGGFKPTPMTYKGVEAGYIDKVNLFYYCPCKYI